MPTRIHRPDEQGAWILLTKMGGHAGVSEFDGVW